MTADPYQASAGASDPGSWNRYAYVLGDPVNYTDPSGLLTEHDNCLDQARVASFCSAFGGGGATIRERTGYGVTEAIRGEIQHSARVTAPTAYSITTRLDYGDGSSITSVNEGRFRHSQAAFLNGLQTVLDVAGLVPGIGEVADGINAGIYAFRGDWANSALSVASMIPFGGQAAGGARLARRFTPDQTALAIWSAIRYEGQEVYDLQKSTLCEIGPERWALRSEDRSPIPPASSVAIRTFMLARLTTYR